MNKFYAWLIVMVAWVLIGLPVAGWLYDNLSGRAAFYADTFGVVVPFLVISAVVLIHQSLAPRIVAVPVILVILGLYAMTVRNLWAAYGKYFGASG